MQREMEKEYLTDEDGEYLLDENGDKIEAVSFIGGIPHPAITEEQREKVERAIDTAFFYQNAVRTWISIIQEEADKYLHSDRSLEEVCAVIQSRVGIYLKEGL